jgi:hypothetical protein
VNVACAPAAAQSITVLDPKGDAVDALGAGPPLLDLASVTISDSGAALDVLVSFYSAIAPPEFLLPNSVLFIFELDTDSSTSTGISPTQNEFAALPFIDAGIDRLFANVSFTPGFGDLLDAALAPIASFPVTYTSSTVGFSLPYTALGAGFEALSFTITIGTFPQPTDALDELASTSFSARPFRRGECNANGVFDLADPIFHIQQIMNESIKLPCAAACDANGDEVLDMGDPIYTLQHQFLAGPPPPAPYPGCDFPPAPLAIDCEFYPSCD